MKLYYRTTFIFILSILSGCNTGNNGVQGEWSEFSYTVGADGEERMSKSKILVENSEYRTYQGRIFFRVEWKAVNTGKDPSNFGWNNKALIDKDGRIYAPSKGDYAEAIQPLDETNNLTVIYSLPKAVKIEELYWGLYHGNRDEGLKYKIKLKPQRTNN